MNDITHNENMQHKELKFSVVIPVYNNEQTIVRTIKSVLAQSYNNYEIIVIDDASTDKSLEVIKNTFSDKVHIIEKVINSGGSVARNAGMDVATGDYIAFLDADDIWHKDKLMLANQILCATPSINLLYHPYTMESISNKSLPESIQVFKLPFIKLLPANIIATPCTIIKNNPDFRFEPTMRYTEDYDLWLRIGYKHKLHFINIPLTQLFRPILSEGGVSANKWAMRRGEMRAYRRLVKLNPIFLLLLPMLWISSLGKHLGKKIIK